MKDWMLAVGVLCLVIVDLIILITYISIEGTGGIRLILNKENPSRIEKVSLVKACSYNISLVPSPLAKKGTGYEASIMYE